VGGSSTTCTRTFQFPIFFIPLTSAIDAADSVSLSLRVSDAPKASSLLSFDLYGLGASAIPGDVVESDWFLGPSADAPDSNVLISSGVINDDAVEGQDIIVDVTYYLKSLTSSSSPSSMSYAVLRLSNSDDLGCSEACDNSCLIKRFMIDHAMGTSLTLEYSPSQSHQSSFVSANCNEDGTIALTYATDAKGNVIPDFSSVGYHKGDNPIPNLPTVTKIAADPDEGDDTARLQDAVDLGGVIELGVGIFRISSPIILTISNTVVR